MTMMYGAAPCRRAVCGTPLGAPSAQQPWVGIAPQQAIRDFIRYLQTVAAVQDRRSTPPLPTAFRYRFTVDPALAGRHDVRRACQRALRVFTDASGRHVLEAGEPDELFAPPGLHRTGLLQPRRPISFCRARACSCR